MSVNENPFSTDDAPEHHDEDTAGFTDEPQAPVLTGTIWATGRRKSSSARVRMRAGTGVILVNNRPFEEYFCARHTRDEVTAPFMLTGTAGRYDILATVKGGGMTGQAGALKLGITRALVQADPSTEKRVRDEGYLTRDARKSERKKYGQRGARASYQYSKR